jgi:hypothetical protein
MASAASRISGETCEGRAKISHSMAGDIRAAARRHGQQSGRRHRSVRGIDDHSHRGEGQAVRVGTAGSIPTGSVRFRRSGHARCSPWPGTSLSLARSIFAAHA